MQCVRLGDRLVKAPSRAPPSKRKGSGFVGMLVSLGVRGVGGAEGAGIRCTRNSPAVRSIFAAGGCARDGARDGVRALHGVSDGRAVSGAMDAEDSSLLIWKVDSSTRRAVLGAVMGAVLGGARAAVAAAAAKPSAWLTILGTPSRALRPPPILGTPSRDRSVGGAPLETQSKR